MSLLPARGRDEHHESPRRRETGASRYLGIPELAV
jgi:hypothetical protein